jgi:hypothetical protein
VGHERKQAGLGEGGKSGMTPTIVIPSEEIRGFMKKRTGRTGEEEDKKRRKSTENGVSVEGEFTFTMAVGRFLREVDKERYFKEQIVGNMKEQLQMRSRQENLGKTKKYLAAVGASEMGRIMEDMEVIGIQRLRFRGTGQRNRWQR